jgi:osmoprotectant transport system ATP-binding protein
VTVPNPTGPSLAFDGASKAYGAAVALAPVDLAIPSGQFVALVGASGSGKSTLLKLINRLVEPSAGRVLLDGADVAAEPVTALRRRIGYVFQSIGLFPHYSVAANIAMPLKIAGLTLGDDRLHELLSLVGLPADYANRLPSQLSGGEAQRVGVARALAGGASLLLMDEPFGALDPVTRDRLARGVRDLHDQLGLTTIMVTHDMAEALLVATRVIVLDNDGNGGRIIADASPAALLANPGHPVAEAMVAVPRAQAAALAALESAA